MAAETSRRHGTTQGRSVLPAYKEGDPDAVVAYYRIHFKSALVRTEDYEKIIARLKASFTKEGILSREPWKAAS